MATFKLEVEFDIDLHGHSEEEIAENIFSAVERAYYNGMFTGETDAEIGGRTWRVLYEDPEKCLE